MTSQGDRLITITEAIAMLDAGIARFRGTKERLLGKIEERFPDLAPATLADLLKMSAEPFDDAIANLETRRAELAAQEQR